MSAEPASSSGSQPTRILPDRTSRHWVEQLRPGHPRRDEAVAQLRELLLRVAYYELSRRGGQLVSIRGAEFDDLAQQAANDALMNVLARLDDFRGLSRFTTWAYKFRDVRGLRQGSPPRLAPTAPKP
jgi:RNA polymerase sigma-70 factor (ECF subfamily)